jgi:hypothetical protein
MKIHPNPFPGALVISLDFELHWGLINTFPLQAIQKRLSGTRQAIPSLLKLFEEFEIHVTWAAVGFLFFHTREDLVAAIPTCRPAVDGDMMSPYDILPDLDSNELSDPYHYASSIIDQILAVPNQEVATHTFAHCIWDRLSPDAEAFRADLKAVLDTARSRGVNISSLVFPQNKYSLALLRVLNEEGFLAFRGNGQHWYSFLDRNDKVSRVLYRCFRLLDRHISLSGSNAYTLESIGEKPPYDIPGSLGLEYFSHAPWLSVFEPLRLRRLKSSLTDAAERSRIFHLWCHPEQFGDGLEEKLDFLRRFLGHFAALREEHGIESLTMKEVAERWEFHKNSSN